jgi:hypothetical protein
MRRKLLALGAAAAIVMAACSSGSNRASPSTTSPAPSTAPVGQTTVANPGVIPSVITVAYVNAVLIALNHIYGNATRTLRSSHAITPEVMRDLRSIFNDPLYDQQIQAAKISLQGAIDNVRPNAGDGTTVVTHLISASPACIFVETSTDLSRVLVHPTPRAASEYYELAPKDSQNNTSTLNPTPWAFAYNSAFLTPTNVKDPCDGSR